ncbi:MAG: beta-hydroxyacyl-ACP dehydratase [Opitutaceae bacterium]|nr:beta-hydroxyacyl-ACP dehydratase [Verrucomicrobiales bacterium]
MRFILVDNILELTPGRRVKAVKYVSPDEDFFRDHFPGFPVVPGVILTEMMAQTAGKCLDAEDRQRGKSMLAKISEACFRDWMRPGETAMIYGEVRKSRPAFATVACYIKVDDRMLCSAELFFSFVPIEKFAAGYRDEVLERYLESPVLTQVNGPAQISQQANRGAEPFSRTESGDRVSP